MRAVLSLLVLVGAWLSLTRLQKSDPAPRSDTAAVAALIPPEKRSQAYLGGGCFWCLEAAFEQLQGVGDVESGYAGGSQESPTYAQVSTGRTGHAEVVRVPYDRSIISYTELLEVFFTIHDPTTRDAQGPDRGSQYRSIILFQTAEEAALARTQIQAQLKLWPRPIVTEVAPLTKFWPGEEMHQNYYARNPSVPYCQSIVAPKVAKVRAKFKHRLRSEPRAIQ